MSISRGLVSPVLADLGDAKLYDRFSFSGRPADVEPYRLQNFAVRHRRSEASVSLSDAAYMIESGKVSSVLHNFFEKNISN
jgi:hypothetical protein